MKSHREWYVCVGWLLVAALVGCVEVPEPVVDSPTPVVAEPESNANDPDRIPGQAVSTLNPENPATAEPETVADSAKPAVAESEEVVDGQQRTDLVDGAGDPATAQDQRDATVAVILLAAALTAALTTALAHLSSIQPRS